MRRIIAEHRGFSLTEIILVAAIMGLLFAVIITGISNYAARQAFDTAVVDVRDAVISARQQTLASENDELYGVHVSSTTVTLFAGNSFVDGAAGNSVITLPGSVMATTSFSNGVTSATFTRLTGIPSATGTIVLTDDGRNETATITVSGTGLVE